MNPSHHVNDLVQIRQDGAVACVEWNRPQAMNAINVASAQAFLKACQWLATRPDVRAVHIGGAGRSFGVGGDLQAMQQGNASAIAAQMIDALHEAVQILANLDAPVIVALHGSVAGGSMSLALACDLAIAADNTVFNLAYGRVGASCDVNGSWALPRIVGLRKALEIALLSENIDATEALRLGLVNRVVPAAELHTHSMALAHRLAQGPTFAHSRLKRLLRDSFQRKLADQLNAEREAFLSCTQTHDFQEGIEAFLGKRAAAFTGH
jgi:2-(1,2-epoxy-1,2-dihydrophenyl)acetyl-CoA isomerase